MDPAYHEAIESATDAATLRRPPDARWLCGIDVPDALADVADAVEKSRYILELPDDWDDEGSPRYAPETWERAVKFVLQTATVLWQSERVRVAAPSIHNGPVSSIDIHWKTRGAELLINIPPLTAERPATYFGLNAQTGLETRGALDPSTPNVRLLKWIAAQ